MKCPRQNSFDTKVPRNAHGKNTGGTVREKSALRAENFGPNTHGKTRGQSGTTLFLTAIVWADRNYAQKPIRIMQKRETRYFFA